MAIRILSVDDEQDLEVLLTHYFRRKIRKGEYEFTFAHNGLEALKLMVEQPNFDIILSDINMPEMDGLTLLTRINEMRNPALKCIMVSAYGDMDNIRSAMNNGAFDFATKPIDLDDLSRTIEKAIEQIDFVRASQCEHDQLESIKNDLAVAGEIQQAILPRKFPPFPKLADVVDIYASMTPAKDVGGDFYDFFRIDECINSVNKLLCNESLDSMFVTVFYGIYNIKTGEVDYTNAGHNPPYLLRRNNTVEPLPLSKNFIVGVFDDFVYTNSSLVLEPGDALVLYTDGVTEAFNENREMFSESGLEKTLKSVPGAGSEEISEAILEDLKDFVGEEPQSDDITMLVLKRLK